MNAMKKVLVLTVILMMCFSFLACTQKRDAASSAEDTEKHTDMINEEAPKPIGSDPLSLPPYSFDIEAKSWQEDGITIKYPIIVNSNMQEETDKANALIKKDLSEVIENIKNNVDDATLTIDGDYVYERYAPDVLSIKYLGSYGSSSSVYPVHFYHTITISLEKGTVIPLSDLFVIDEAFVDSLVYWMYAPYDDNLNLEESVGSVYNLLSEQYSRDELVQWLSQADAPYYLTSRGLILSFEVTHVLGDHLELAMNYEFLEKSMRRDHPIWKNYMFLSDESNP